MEQICNKLVRDKIPQIIADQGATPVTRQLDAAEFPTALENKLLEECREVLAAHGSDRLMELADVLTVVQSLAELNGADLRTLEKLATQKAEQNGAFEKRIFLEKIVR